MSKFCKNCEFFHIKYEPIKDVDFGQAECKKHNLVADFASHRLLNRLRCVEKGEQMDDLISRQAAIKALHDEIVRRRISEDTNDNGTLDEFDTEAILRQLPSTQPEIIRCKDCKHWIPYDWMFSEVWQSKNIADYPEDEIGCNYCDMAMKADDFCSRAERRTE